MCDIPRAFEKEIVLLFCLFDYLVYVILLHMSFLMQRILLYLHVISYICIPIYNKKNLFSSIPFGFKLKCDSLIPYIVYLKQMRHIFLFEIRLILQ